jgi:hypothetical protein
MLTKLTKLVKDYQSDIIIAAAIMLMTYIGYNIGKIAVYSSLKTPIVVENKADLNNIVRPLSGTAGETVSPSRSFSCGFQQVKKHAVSFQMVSRCWFNIAG